MFRSILTFILFASWTTALPLRAEEVVRRLTQEEAVKAAVVKPQPEYPPVARQLKIQGMVQIEISITPAGSVDNTKIIAGNAALTAAAVNAVKQWRFEPFSSDGKPVRAVTIISFSFHPKGS